jgi:2'-5' RNA ligase
MGAAEKHGVGVPSSYKEQAKKGCDVLFCVTIKGRSTLVDDIPLHMSLKIFGDKKEFDLDEMKEYVEEHDICSPDPKDLTFKPIIFTAEQSKMDYYMLKIEGLPPKYKALYDHYGHVGNVYKNFMTHVTIDKKLYDDLKENGVTADDVEFGPLTLEHGANNPVHTFEKSEEMDKSDYGPKKLDLYSHVDNSRRKEGRTGEVAHIGPNKAIHAARPSANDRAGHQASLDRQKSKKNPVKVYSKKERKKLATKMGVLAASEDMQKGIKHVAAAIGVMGAMQSSPTIKDASPPREPASIQQPSYSSNRMLNTIASVESQKGKMTDHKPAGGMHTGESAYGKYALMPATIRDTIHMNHDLKAKYAKGMALRGDDMRRYMQDNPGLEDTVAQKHLARLEHHFGQNPEKIGYSWLEGIRGGYKAQNNKQDISQHWHVKKIKDAYDKEK